MRILFLAPRFPLPAVKGDKLRAWQFLRLLGETHDVTLLSFIASEEERDMRPAVEEVCRVYTVPFSKVGGALKLAAGPFRPFPYQALLHESSEVQRHLERLLPECDAIHCNTLRMAANLPQDLPAPLVVDFIDALSTSYRRRADEAGLPMSALFRWEARRLAALEAGLIKRAAFTCAVSAEDAAALGEGVIAVPHGVDTETFSPPAAEGAREHIIFTGNLSYPPNVEAALELAAEIFPRIRRAVPGARLFLVGAEPSPRVKRLAGEGVEVTGFVPSMVDELRKRAVAVVPVRSGGGVKTKILEAMACATPVVATPAALAGIPARSGIDVLVADDGDRLAAQTIALLEDKAKAAELGRAGRAFVAERFSWRVTGGVLVQRYAELEARLS